MIRKWLKFNASFIDVIKNSTNSSKSLDSKYASDNFQNYPNPGNHSSMVPSTSVTATTVPSVAKVNGCFRPLSSVSSISINYPVKLWSGDPWKKGDLSEFSDSEDGDAEAYADEDNKFFERTELFEIGGPEGSAYLVEVRTRDLEEVHKQLNNLKGEIFHFDKTVLDRFAIKCLLTAEPLATAKPKDRARLAKIHAIVSGSEEVQELSETGQFLFVNSIDRMMRAKTILEKFQYKISAILYRFQPKQKVSLNEKLSKFCREFLAEVENLPKVLSVTHNL